MAKGLNRKRVQVGGFENKRGGRKIWWDYVQKVQKSESQSKQISLIARVPEWEFQQ